MKTEEDKIIENIFKINLRIQKKEKLLVFTDNKSKKLISIARKVSYISNTFCNKMSYLQFKSTESHGAEPPEELWREAFGNNIVNELINKKILISLINKRILPVKLKEAERIVKKYKEDAVNAVVALSYHSTSHTRFRDLLTRICETRYASMPTFEGSMFKTAMSVDWKKMEIRTNRMAQRVQMAEIIEVCTPNGTSIAFSKKGRIAKADTGIITTPGKFSNLPAGEVFLAPLEGTANGRLVLEWAPTRKLKSPVTLYIKKGNVEKIEGKENYINDLKKKMSERKENRNLAELGIGTNDKAVSLNNILESEKIFGTIHMALGDNSSFGGRVSTPFHQDFIFFKPTVTLIHKDGIRDVLLKNGELKRKRSR
ncbi:MAG: aminopeptidase [Thermodesulfovibrionia bacterium]|nr:aminopeptidase [Thermodesulfovibrionia bacterium]